MYSDEVWNSPKMSSNGAMVLQNAALMEQNDVQMALRWQPDEPRGFKMASGSTNLVPRCTKMALRDPKMAPRDPKMDPRWLLVTPRWTQGGHKRSQDGTKMVSIWTQEASEGRRPVPK